MSTPQSQSTGPRYQVIDATPAPQSMRVDRTGVYATLAEANRYLNMRGPPLPIIIQILPGQEDDLTGFIDVVKSIPNGDSNVHGGEFVKGVAEKLESGNFEVWPNHTSFYALVNGTRAARYIAQEWRYVSDVTSGTTEKSPGFATFTHAFVWALAGGNPGLANLGLLDRWGWVPLSKRTTVGGGAAPSTPSPSLSQPQASSQPPASSPPASIQGPSISITTPSRIRREPPLTATPPSPSVPRLGKKAPTLLASLQSPLRGMSTEGSGSGSEASDNLYVSSPARGKGRERPRKAPDFFPVRGRNPQQPTASVPPVRAPAPSLNANPGSSQAPLAEPHAPRFCSPATLFPLSILQNRRFRSNNLPIIFRRSPLYPGVSETTWSSNFGGSNEEMFLPAKTTLPPFVEFSLLAMGWDEGILKVVQVAWSCGGKRDDFILTLSEAGIPLSEGYLLWMMLERERVLNGCDQYN